MKNLNVVNNFLKDIQANGVSKRDVELIEDTVGSNFISSIVNIKTLTSERSEIALNEVVGTVNDFIADEKEEVSSKAFTFSEILILHRRMLNYVGELKKHCNNIDKLWNSNIKNNLLSAKELYTFKDNGKNETVVENIFNLTGHYGELFSGYNYKKIVDLSEDTTTNMDFILDNLNDKITFIDFLAYRDNDLAEYLENPNYFLTNINVTVKEVFTSFDEWHMIIEMLDKVYTELVLKFNMLNSGELYLVNYTDSIYTRYKDLLDSADVSVSMLRILTTIFKRVNV